MKISLPINLLATSGVKFPSGKLTSFANNILLASVILLNKNLSTVLLFLKYLL